MCEQQYYTDKKLHDLYLAKIKGRGVSQNNKGVPPKHKPPLSIAQRVGLYKAGVWLHVISN